jgi:hypothetical protein
MQPAASDQSLLTTPVKRNAVDLILMKVSDLITLLGTRTAGNAAQLNNR